VEPSGAALTVTQSPAPPLAGARAEGAQVIADAVQLPVIALQLPLGPQVRCKEPETENPELQAVVQTPFGLTPLAVAQVPAFPLAGAVTESALQTTVVELEPLPPVDDTVDVPEEVVPPPEEVVPEEVVPEDVVPPPEDVVPPPEEVVPEEVVPPPEEVVPEDVVPEDLVPEDVVPDDVVPDDVVPPPEDVVGLELRVPLVTQAVPV